MRICSKTGKPMTEGYVVDHFDTLLYFSDAEHLVEHLRSLDWEDIDGNKSTDCETSEDLMDYFYAEDYYYYTTFDDEEI